MSPLFLSREEVLEIHEVQIARFGGSAGLRDAEGIESAIAQPTATFAGQWLHEDLFQMAAAYLFHLVMNHPFVDGNKRTGMVAARVFLLLNGYDLCPPQAELVDIVLTTASGRAAKPEIAAFLREHSKPLS